MSVKRSKIGLNEVFGGRGDIFPVSRGIMDSDRGGNTHPQREDNFFSHIERYALPQEYNDTEDNFFSHIER